MKFINLTIFLTVFLYSSLQASENLGSFTEKFIRDYSDSEQLDYFGIATDCEHMNISSTDVHDSLKRILILRRLKPTDFALKSDLRGIYLDGKVMCMDNFFTISVQLISKTGPTWGDTFSVGIPAITLLTTRNRTKILQSLERNAEIMIAAFIKAHMNIK